MDVQTIAETNSLIAHQRATTRGFDELRPEDFFGLLIAELQSQDPLNPKDNEQLLAQMSSIRQMEQNAVLTETLETLAAEQRFGATSSLIGHYIAGRVTDQAGLQTEIQGLVIGVRFENNRAILELHNGRSLPAERVEQVTLVENLPAHILEQLQAELGGVPAGSSDEDETPPVGDDPPADDEQPTGGDEEPPAEDADLPPAPARLIYRDPRVPQPTLRAHVRELNRGVEGFAGVLDALFAPGFSVEFGS